MVCLLQLSEQLHFNWWVQAQVRAVLICDIPHLWHNNSHTMRINFSHSENNYMGLGPGFWDILQLGSNNSDRSYMLKWHHMYVCAHNFCFTLFIFHVALVMLFKCKQWWLFSRPSLHLTDDCLESAPLYFPAPINECAEHKQVKQSAILIFSRKKQKKKNSGAGESELQAMLVFVSVTIHSVVWVPFASNITTAKSMKSIFLISAWFAICYHTSEFYMLSLWEFTTIYLFFFLSFPHRSQSYKKKICQNSELASQASAMCRRLRQNI